MHGFVGSVIVFLAGFAVGWFIFNPLIDMLRNRR